MKKGVSSLETGDSMNGENRLIMASNGNTVVQYAYDYMGRRFSKIVNNGTTATTNYYIYDGWNLIAEKSSELSVQSSSFYTWGFDLSGSLQGDPLRQGYGGHAGGIGGLLSCSSRSVSGTETYFPVADANGNITEYVTTNGTVAAHYEYNPFGGIIASSGTKASDFHFRFSTKYIDDETGLYNYGLRDLDVELGRWISRDPLGDRASYPSIVIRMILQDIFSKYRNAYLHLALDKDRSLAQRIASVEVADKYTQLLHFVIIGEPTIMLYLYGANNYINSLNNLIDYFDFLGLSGEKCPPKDKKCPKKKKGGSPVPVILEVGGAGLLGTGKVLGKTILKKVSVPMMWVGAISTIAGFMWNAVVPDKEDIEKKIKSDGGDDADSWFNMNNNEMNKLRNGDKPVTPEDKNALKEMCKE